MNAVVFHPQPSQYSFYISNLFLKTMGLEVNNCVCAEVAHPGDVTRSRSGDDLQTRATG
jgi:hypothetical protein